MIILTEKQLATLEHIKEPRRKPTPLVEPAEIIAWCEMKVKQSSAWKSGISRRNHSRAHYQGIIDYLTAAHKREQAI